MVKTHSDHGKSWTSTAVIQLKQLAKETTTTRVIGLKQERTEDAARAKAGEENVSMNPANQSLYNRRKP